MEIFALIGKSGTGKSYKAQTVSGRYGIEHILDDGLLVAHHKIVAGKSAKREKTKFAAVRRAVFSDLEHRKEMISAIKAEHPEKLLVLGTSEHMIEKILHTLGFANHYEPIFIHEIATPEEMEMAQRFRKEEGMHVIPVPTFEIKKAFSGYFIDSIRQFSKRNEKVAEYSENTVVRPTFSYLGSFDIKDSAVKTIIQQAAKACPGIMDIPNVNVKKEAEGVRVTVMVTVLVPAAATGSIGVTIPQIIAEMAENIKNDLEFMTGFYAIEINTVVKRIFGLGWQK